MLVEQFKNVVDDRVFGLGEEVWLRKGGLRDVRSRVFSSKLGDDVVDVLRRAEALPFALPPSPRSLTCWRWWLLRETCSRV